MGKPALPARDQEGDRLPRLEEASRSGDDGDLRVVRAPAMPLIAVDEREESGQWPSAERVENLSGLVRDITIRVAEIRPVEFDAVQLNYLRLVSLVRWNDRAVHDYESARAAIAYSERDRDRRAIVAAFDSCLAHLCRGVRFAALLDAAENVDENRLAPAPPRLVQLCASTMTNGDRPMSEILPDGLSVEDEFLSFDDLAASLRWLDAGVEQLLKRMMGISRPRAEQR